MNFLPGENTATFIILDMALLNVYVCCFVHVRVCMCACTYVCIYTNIFAFYFSAWISEIIYV